MLPLLSLKEGSQKPFLPVFKQRLLYRCGSLCNAMHVSRRDIMPTVLSNCCTLKRAIYPRGLAVLPLLSLQKGSLRPFLTLFKQKKPCRCGSLWNAMHVSSRDIKPTVLWTCRTFKRVKFSRGATVVPLLSLKVSVLRRFLDVYRLLFLYNWKTRCKEKHR